MVKITEIDDGEDSEERHHCLKTCRRDEHTQICPNMIFLIQEDFQKRLITNATDEEGVTRYI